MHVQFELRNHWPAWDEIPRYKFADGIPKEALQFLNEDVVLPEITLINNIYRRYVPRWRSFTFYPIRLLAAVGFLTFLTGAFWSDRRDWNDRMLVPPAVLTGFLLAGLAGVLTLILKSYWSKREAPALAEIGDRIENDIGPRMAYLHGQLWSMGRYVIYTQMQGYGSSSQVVWYIDVRIPTNRTEIEQYFMSRGRPLSPLPVAPATQQQPVPLALFAPQQQPQLQHQPSATTLLQPALPYPQLPQQQLQLQQQSQFQNYYGQHPSHGAAAATHPGTQPVTATYSPAVNVGSAAAAAAPTSTSYPSNGQQLPQQQPQPPQIYQPSPPAPAGGQWQQQQQYPASSDARLTTYAAAGTFSAGGAGDSAAVTIGGGGGVIATTNPLTGAARPTGYR